MRWVRQFYLLIIPVTIGLMLLHQGGDWLRKLLRSRFRRAIVRVTRPGAAYAHAHAELRMLPFERVQHALLVISFFTLVWTGFALKYPDQWWARPLLLLEVLKGLVIDPGSRHVTHVLLQEEHLWGRKDVAIPISTVTRAADEASGRPRKQQVQDLPPVDIDHPDR